MTDGDTTESSGAQKALEHFKDWSNYLLVTTVAAMGWVAESKTDHANLLLKELAVWSFGLAIIYGILTLALVPLVAEELTARTKSIYDVKASCTLFGVTHGYYLTQACRPQHILFVAGVVFYGLAMTGAQYVAIGAAVLAIGSIVVGLRSIPRAIPDKGAGA
ncbi:MAG TPA: hypothetical protein VGO61_07135 [Steroidobacteraceae bacterium]|jgi:Ca2+/H+ antiporter|nr:hypothetical protein [Steroidobacteraceae bacterium]